MQQIELYSKLQNQDAFRAVQVMGESLAKSGMFGCSRAEQGEVLAMICLTEGMTPSQVTNKYHIIDGKLSRKAGSALAEFKARGGKYKWIRTGQEPDQDTNNREAIGEFSLDGETITVRFSMAEAKTAGLIRSGSSWEKLPWKMLRARVTSDALGMLAPEIYYGDDEGEPQQSARHIDLSGGEPKPQSAPPQKPVETVFEAEVVSDMPIEQAEPHPTPEPAPAPEPAPTQSVQSGDTLPDETVIAMEKAIGAHAKNVMAYFQNKGWLKPGQGLEFLPKSRAGQVLRNPSGLIEAATKLAKEAQS